MAEDVPSCLRRRRTSLSHKIPLKLIGKKCSRTTRLVASSRVLHSSITTRNCDIIMTLPAKTKDSTLMWLLARLRSRTPQIHVHVRHWNNTGVYAFYMTASYEDLLKGAEDLALVKPLKSEVGGGMKEFLFEDQHFYEGIEDEHTFLVSEERQAIVYNMLLNLRALKGEKFDHVEFLEGQPIVPLLESAHIVSQVFPLHDKETIAQLQRTWVRSFWHTQPLEKVSGYFGVKIAMYFAYLGHYTSALIIPTLVGVLFWCNQGDSQVLDDIFSILYALFILLWSSVYLEFWRRRSAELAYKWGTLDKKDELLQDPRPLYTGDLVTSPVTGRLEPYYPAWKRNIFRYFITVPVIAFCLFVVFFVMLLIFQLQEWVNGLVKKEEVPSFCQFLPKVFLALVIWVLDEIYKKIAYWLTDKENYRMEETYEKHLIVKLVLFQFVNSFLSLFYIAFYLQDMNRLRDQLGTLLITRQVIGNIREAVVPYVLWKAKLMKVGYEITGHMSPHTLEKEIRAMSKDLTTGVDIQSDNDSEMEDSSSKEDNSAKDEPSTRKRRGSVTDKVDGKPHKSELILTQAEVESTMKKYEDTFDDYLEMFIQYGYVILFSSAFPLAALCAFLNNIIEIRSDAFKLCIHHQRPFGKCVRSIGIWLYALRAMGLIAVVVNVALIGVSGQLKRVHSDLDPNNHVIYILAIEHLLLMLKMYISSAIPSQPQWIAEEMARLEFQRREALRNLEPTPRDARYQFFDSSRSPSPSTEPCVSPPGSPPFPPVRRNTSHLSFLHRNSHETTPSPDSNRRNFTRKLESTLENNENEKHNINTTVPSSVLRTKIYTESCINSENERSDSDLSFSEFRQIQNSKNILKDDTSCHTEQVPSEKSNKHVTVQKEFQTHVTSVSNVNTSSPPDSAISTISENAFSTTPDRAISTTSGSASTQQLKSSLKKDGAVVPGTKSVSITLPRSSNKQNSAICSTETSTTPTGASTPRTNTRYVSTSTITLSQSSTPSSNTGSSVILPQARRHSYALVRQRSQSEEEPHSLRDRRTSLRTVYAPWSSKPETRQRALEAVRNRHSSESESAVKQKSDKES